MNEILSASPRLSEKAIPVDLSRIRRLYFIRCFIPHKLQAAALDRRILSRSIKGYVDPYISFRHQITGYLFSSIFECFVDIVCFSFCQSNRSRKDCGGVEGGRKHKTFRCNFDRVDNEKSDPKDSKRSLSYRIPWPAST